MAGWVIFAEGEGVEVLGQKIRPFSPLSHDSPGAGKTCPACTRPLAAGDVPCLVAMDSEENRKAVEEARAAGRPAYNAAVTLAHWTCLTGSSDPVGDYKRYFGLEST